MTVCTAYVVAPMLSPAKIVVLFFARMAGETSLGRFLRRLILKGNNLRRIAFLRVCLTRAVTRLTTCHFIFP